MTEQFTQYGLVGLMIAAGIMGVAWSGKRILGQNGLLSKFLEALNLNSQSIEAVADCVRQHDVATGTHIEKSTETHTNVDRLIRTTRVALDEVESLCGKHGVDASEQCSRIRRELEQVQ